MKHAYTIRLESNGAAIKEQFNITLTSREKTDSVIGWLNKIDWDRSKAKYPNFSLPYCGQIEITTNDDNVTRFLLGKSVIRVRSGEALWQWQWPANIEQIANFAKEDVNVEKD